jgi:mannose-6-phosphate isomerase-like protein (cupin superfamily)
MCIPRRGYAHGEAKGFRVSVSQLSGVGNFEIVDAQALVDMPTDVGGGQTLCRVNDSVIKIGAADKEHAWHKHDREDKFFFVVEGEFLIDLEDKTVLLTPKQGFTVPKGVMHRTRAVAERTVMLTIGSSSPETAYA